MPIGAQNISSEPALGDAPGLCCRRTVWDMDPWSRRRCRVTERHRVRITRDTQPMAASGDSQGVRWIGGGSGAAKSAVAGVLAERFELRVYAADATIGEHGREAGPDAPLLRAFVAQSMDERWLSDGQTMLEAFPWFAGERFDRIVADLGQASEARLILAEGFRLLPRLVAPLIRESWEGIWLIATPDFRRRVFLERPVERQFWLRTSDPALALERLLDRDALFAASVADEARHLSLKTVRVDGSVPLYDLADEVADWLRLSDSAPANAVEPGDKPRVG